ncbi:MAG: hypothetical protein U0359_25450 [Byssovorax sp.]
MPPPDRPQNQTPAPREGDPQENDPQQGETQDPEPAPQEVTDAPGSGETHVDTQPGLHFALVVEPNPAAPQYQASHFADATTLGALLARPGYRAQLNSASLPATQALYHESDTNPARRDAPPTAADRAAIANGFLRNDSTFINGGTLYARIRNCYGLRANGQPAFGKPIVFQLRPHNSAEVSARGGGLPIETMIRLSTEYARQTSGPQANIASIAIFMHGIPSGIEIPHSGASSFAGLLQGHVMPSLDIILYCCLTAQGGMTSYAGRLADAVRPQCGTWMRVFGHRTAAQYGINVAGSEFLSQNGGAVEEHTNRQVCLPDSYLTAPAEITRLATATGQTEDVIRQRVIAAADAWMNGRGGHVSVGGPACYTIGWRRAQVIAAVQDAWQQPGGGQAALAPPHRGRGH